ncbi:MAG: MBL fold metallo-hydrolase [Luteitalea sp.]|nr:MBL fold metallo-hydrolase [Luteitalea sp.]
MIGCDCRVCRSTDPRDRRLRPSILIQLSGASDAGASRVGGAVRTILVDTSTDLRAQALAHDVRRVDAILFTHSHADHVLGLDEVRRYNHLQREPIPAYADERTLADLRRTFSYIFTAATPMGGGIPQIGLSRIVGPFSLGGVEIVPVPLMHGERQILGFRIGSFAYLTDCNGIPGPSWPLLSGVQTLVLDALRDRPHPTHFSVREAVEVVARLAPERAYFTHICHDLSHAETCARLPPGVELAYDGLVLEITDRERRVL